MTALSLLCASAPFELLDTADSAGSLRCEAGLAEDALAPCWALPFSLSLYSALFAGGPSTYSAQQKQARTKESVSVRVCEGEHERRCGTYTSTRFLVSLTGLLQHLQLCSVFFFPGIFHGPLPVRAHVCMCACHHVGSKKERKEKEEARNSRLQLHHGLQPSLFRLTSPIPASLPHSP